MLSRRELERWLCGPDVPPLSPAEIAWILGVPLAKIGDTTVLRAAERLRGMRFTLAVLRDVFKRDDEVTTWLHTPRRELGLASAFDLLLAGLTASVEELAVREWHRRSTTPAAALHDSNLDLTAC